jgi:hypothetical protein
LPVSMHAVITVAARAMIMPVPHPPCSIICPLRLVTLLTGGALRVNLTRLAPKVLPVREQLRYVVTMFARRYLGIRSLAPYTPNFQSAANHICIHTGARFNWCCTIMSSLFTHPLHVKVTKQLQHPHTCSAHAPSCCCRWTWSNRCNPKRVVPD